MGLSGSQAISAGLQPNQQRCPDRHAFKKTCPFEITRRVRPKADNPIDRQFCRAD
jgi:hypothetical protein